MKEPSLLALDVAQLSVNYDETPVLWDITIQIPQGVILGVVGPNGAGKSTLIKSLLGLVKPLSGRVDFFGKPIDKARQKIAYVPQRSSVDWDFPITVKELVLMGRYGRLGLFKRPREADKVAADHYLELVGMSAYRDRQISQLSGGQQQRIFLARALLQEADLYFMDEPFTGVDLATEKMMMKLFHSLKEKGKTLVIVHHDLGSLKEYFDWTLLLNTRLIACGPTSEVVNPANLEAAYGKNDFLFDFALKRSHEKQAGVQE